MDKTIKKALGLQMNGFNSEALNVFQKALEKEPSNPLLCEYYGSALASAGRLVEAKKYLKKALNHSITKPQVLNNLATVNRGLGIYEEGLLNVESALKFNPQYTDAWINCGNINSDLKQWKQAIQCYQNAIRLNESDPGPHVALANAYLRNGDFDNAMKLYHSLQEKNDDPALKIGELICYRAMEDYDKALVFAKALKDEYDNELMWFEWVQTLWLAKKYDLVASESSIAVEKFGQYPAMDSLIDLSKNTQ